MILLIVKFILFLIFALLGALFVIHSFIYSKKYKLSENKAAENIYPDDAVVKLVMDITGKNIGNTECALSEGKYTMGTGRLNSIRIDNKKADTLRVVLIVDQDKYTVSLKEGVLLYNGETRTAQDFANNGYIRLMPNRIFVLNGMEFFLIPVNHE